MAVEIIKVRVYLPFCLRGRFTTIGSVNVGPMADSYIQIRRDQGEGPGRGRGGVCSRAPGGGGGGGGVLLF